MKLDFIFGSRRLEEVDIDEQTAAKAQQEFEVDTVVSPLTLLM